MKIQKMISPQVINRLPKYLRCMKQLDAHGVERVSSAQIAKMLGTTPSQVRQDFSMFGTFGATGYGYAVTTLIREFSKILGVYERHNIVVVGVGCIGRALLEHMEFEQYNYRVCAAFDVDPTVVGSTINDVKVYDFACVSRYMQEHDVDICMLTVSTEAAKSVADVLVKNGVPAIWNFTNEDLELDTNEVVVQNVNFLDSLFVLTYYLEEQKSQMKNTVPRAI